MSAALLPSSMLLAPYIGAVDLPGEQRRMHRRPIPRCGGMALFVALWSILGALGIGGSEVIALLLATALLFLMGLADDIFGLPAGFKLLGQLVASLPVVMTLTDTAAGGLLALLWLCLMTNAHNMIDGLDGLCGSVVAIESGGAAVLLLARGDAVGALVAVGTLGCCLGYLPYNFHPARVFMGDEGALFLGFFVGWLSLRAYTAYDALYLLPLLCLLPLCDLVFVVLRRLSRGQNPLRADRGHLHHKLCDAGVGQRSAVFLLLRVSVFGAALALVALAR